MRDDAIHPSYIETIPKRGYRLIAPVEAVTDKSSSGPLAPSVRGADVASDIGQTVADSQSASPAPGISITKPILFAGGLVAVAILAVGVLLYSKPAQESPPATAPESVTDAPQERSAESTTQVAEEPSIAVLPFVNVSSDPEQEYFSDGMAEDILNGLVRLSGIKVIARTSSFQFKGQNLDIRQIGKQLDVTHVLEGSVRKSGDRIRVTAQLNSAADGAHLWSQQYDRVLTDIFEVQDEITRHILYALKTELVNADQATPATDNVEAHNAFLLGRHHGQRGEYNDAIQALEKAIALDAGYVPPYVALAFAHTNLGTFGLAPYPEKLAESRSLYEQARKLDPDHAGVRGLGASLLFRADRDYQGAIDEGFRLCGEGFFCNSLANHLSDLGHFEMAIRVYDLALRNDPISGLALFNKGRALTSAGRFDEALEVCEMRESLGYPSGLGRASVAWTRRDMTSLQSEIVRGEAAWGPGAQIWRPLFQALMSFEQGNRTGVKTALAALPEEGHRPDFSTMYVALLQHDLDGALTRFEKIASVSGPALFWIHNIGGDAFPEFQSHPRYQRALIDVGLDDVSLAKLTLPPLPDS
jgi:TolB-like protein|tara:strand:+ start:37 stop:1794 length:1758 start_codon:yes stop_codon:yes gene_type:complete